MHTSEQLSFAFEEKTPEHSVFSSVSMIHLEKALKDHVGSLKTNDPLSPVVILVPSAIAGRYLKKTILAGGIQILNFKSLALRLAGTILASKSMVELPSLGEDVLLGEVLDTTVPASSILHPFIGSPGLHRLMKSIIKDLRQSGLGEVSLDSTSAGSILTPIPAGAGRDRLKVVLDIYRGYRKALAGKYYDVEDILDAASLEVSHYNEIFNTDRLIVYSFFYLDPIQRRFLQKLARNTAITAFFPTLPGNVLTESTGKFFDSLTDRQQNLDLTPAGELSALQSLGMHLFENQAPLKHAPGQKTPAPPQKADETDRTVTIRSCASPADEVREIIRSILRSARRGVRFDEIAILLKNPLEYHFLLQEAFQTIGIPAYFHNGLPLGNTPVGRGIQLFLNLDPVEFPRFEVMEFITSGSARFDKIFKQHPPSPETWEPLTRKAGVRKGINTWTRQLNNIRLRYEREREKLDPGSSDTEQRKERIKSMLSNTADLLRYIQMLHEALKSFRPTASWTAHADNLIRLIRDFITGDETHLDTIIRTLEGMKDLDSLRNPVSFDVFRSTVQEVLDSRVLPLGELGMGCVNVFSLASAPGLTFRHIYIPGMVAKQFPVKQHENPLFYEFERDRINREIGSPEETGGKNCHILTRSELQEQDPLLFSLLVRSCLEQLVLSFPRTDSETGTAVVPSPYILETARILAGERIEYGFLEESPEKLESKLPQFETVKARIYQEPYSSEIIDSGEYRVDILKRSLKQTNPGPDLNPLMDLAVLNPSFRGALLRREHQLHTDIFTPYNGRITSGDLLDWIRKKSQKIFEPASASKLEQFHTCPYRFFLRRFMGFESQEAPEEVRTISAKDRGDIYHKILYDFYTMLKEQDLFPMTMDRKDKYISILDTILEERLRQAKESGITGDFSSWYEQEISVRENLNAFLNKEIEVTNDIKHFRVGFNPDLFEYSFGMPDETNQVPVKAAEFVIDANTTIKFMGCIDRIDFNKDKTCCVVIDYKTGSHDSYKDGKDRLAGGKHLQLPLYLTSVRQVIEGLSDIEKSYALYYFISKKEGMKELTFSGQALQTLQDELRKLIKGVLDGVQDGMFIPYPGKVDPETRRGDHCRFCDYNCICPDDVDEVCRRKDADPFISSFKELKEIQ